nr:retrovirus-related Pol polyprotein from transposon TNT 1-94 [Tanacetum cinerariifolium]
MTVGNRKPESQWTCDVRKATNLDQRLKSLIMSVLPDDQLNSVINCETVKSTLEDLILYHKDPSDVKESMVMDLKLCYNTFKFKEDEEDVSSNDNEMVEVKVLMALGNDENVVVGKESAKNGVDQLIEDPSSSGQIDLVFVKSSADDTKVSIPCVERPLLSEAEGFNLPNHDTGRIFLAKSQVKVTDSSVIITDSSVTDYDSADESSVCSIPFSPPKKLAGAEPIFGPKIIKSILKSNSTFKAETLKGVNINEPTSTPAKGNKNVLASKKKSAPADKLKNMKTEDNIPLSVVMKEQK